MKKIIGLLCVSGLALAAPLSHASSICDAIAGNLVANCGFETGDFTSWTLAGNDVPGEAGNLYGVEGTDPFPLPGGTAPNSGNFQAFFADLAANPTTLSQTISTVAGGEYSVSFYLAQQLVGPGTVNNAVSVAFGGTTLTSLTDVAVQGYEQFSFTTHATTSSSLLAITLGNDVGEFLLDDVSVTAIAVPEPASAWLMLIGLGGGLGVLAHRRRRSCGALSLV
jgi:PEP-CTERM motif